MKLDWFRRHRKKLLGFLAAFLMITWGMGSSIYYLAERRSAGILFGEKIPLDQFTDMMRRWQAAVLGRRVEQDILTRYIWEQLMLLHEAQRYRIGVSSKEIASYAVARLGRPALSDTAAYVAHLRNIGLTESEYEQTIREAVEIQKLQDLIRDTVKITPDEVWQRYAIDHEKVKVKYITLIPDFFLGDVSVADDEMLAFYKRHRTMVADAEEGTPGYKLDEAVKVAYVIGEYDALAKQVKVTGDELRKYYDEHKEDFKVEEPPPKDAKDTPKEEADQKKSGDAEEVKKTNSEEPSPKPTAEDADQNPKESTSGAKEDEKPSAEEKKPQYRPFNEVKDEIRKTIARQKAESLVEEVIDKADKAIQDEIDRAEAVDLKKITETIGKDRLKFVETDFISRKEAGELIKDCPGLAEELERRDEKDPPSTIMTCPAGKFIFTITDRRRPRILTFDEAREHVANDLKREKALKRAVEVAQSVAKECKGKEIEKALELLRSKVSKESAEKLKVEESKSFGRPQRAPFGDAALHCADTGIPGDHPEFGTEAFRVADNELGVAVEERKPVACYLMQVVAHEAADKEEFKKNERMFSQQYRYEKMGEVLALWLEDVRERAALKQFKF